MFTGLVETVGKIREVAARAGSTRIAVASSLDAERADLGASIAVDGVCLTVTARRGDRFWCDAVRETLERSTLGRLRPGSRVNLERSLTLASPLGGHLVQGHVDGIAEVLAVKRQGDDYRLRVRLPDEVARFVALKGSVALSGVSLTVSAIDAGWFEVALIPETLKRTTLGDLRPGEAVNLEVDLLARYLDRLLGRELPGEETP